MGATLPSLRAEEQAAIRRFPSEAKLVEELMIHNESFRGLCEDLAAAEQALRATDQMPEPLRRERRAECQEWVESLTEEIQTALREAKVIPIAGAKDKPPRCV
jgi:hypothetical protein